MAGNFYAMVLCALLPSVLAQGVAERRAEPPDEPGAPCVVEGRGAVPVAGPVRLDVAQRVELPDEPPAQAGFLASRGARRWFCSPVLVRDAPGGGAVERAVARFPADARFPAVARPLKAELRELCTA